MNYYSGKSGEWKFPRPNADVVRNLKEEVERTPAYMSDVEMLNAIRLHREKAFPVDVPKALIEATGIQGLEFRDTSIADELLTLPSLFTGDRPKLNIDPHTESPERTRHTTRLERATMAYLLDDIGSREPGPSTFERLADGVFEGAGWTKLVLAVNRWEEALRGVRSDTTSHKSPYSRRYAERKVKCSEGVPLEWIAVDALNLRPIWAGNRLRAMIEVQNRSTYATFRQYGIGMDESGIPYKSDTATYLLDSSVLDTPDCKFVQYWDAHWAAYFVEYAGTWVEVCCWEHGYNLGRVPYYPAFGWMANYKHGRLCGWSAAESKRTLVEYISRLRTVFLFLGIRDAIPPVHRTLSDDSLADLGTEGDVPAAVPYVLGHESFGRSGEERKVVEFPNNSDKLLQEIEASTRDKESLSPARFTGNQGDLGGAGFAIASIHERDRRRYSTFANSILRSLQEVTTDSWKLLSQLDEEVVVHPTDGMGQDRGWVILQPSDFRRAVKPVWTLNANATSALVILERLLAAQVQNGSLSQYQMIERMGENPDEVFRLQAISEIMRSDQYKQALQRAVFAEWGQGSWGELQGQSDQIVNAITPPQVPPGGTPQAGPMPPPGAMQGGAGQPQIPDMGSLGMSPAGGGAMPGTEMTTQGQGGFPPSPGVMTAAASLGQPPG